MTIVDLAEKSGQTATDFQYRDAESDSVDDAISPYIPKKFRGTANDQKDMQVLGKMQELRRNFKFITMVGFASTVMSSWEILLPLSGFILQDGGTGGLFWGIIIVGVGVSLIYASLAEMASMSPTAAGQYHWVSEHAPPRLQKFFSYMTGWLCAVGWQVYMAGVSFMVGSILQSLIILNDFDYVFQRWHGTLLAIAVICFAIIFNTALASKLPFVEGLILILHLCGLFAVVIPLWVLGPVAPARETILTFSNDGGWPTIGLSTMIGLSVSLSVCIGYDCSVHMSEEVRDASVTVPRAIMWSVLPNVGLTLLMGASVIFTMGTVDDVLNSQLTMQTEFPFIQAFLNATRSRAAVNGMLAILVVCLTSCNISQVATASRQIWSFARDRGLPFSGFLSTVSPGWNLPLRAVVVSVCVTALLSLINIGSYTALNAINAFGGVSIQTTYILSIGSLIWRRLFGAPLPPRRWSLGKFGLAINVASVAFLLPTWVFALFPLGQPVSLDTMNWASLMFGGVMSLAVVYYVVKARHEYTGPVVQMKRSE